MVNAKYTAQHVEASVGDGVVLDRKQRYGGGSTCITKTWKLDLDVDALLGGVSAGSVPTELFAKYILNEDWAMSAY